MLTRRDTTVRLFLTVWLVYVAFLTTNVARETYLAVALGGSYTIRVDPFLGLHPDIFEIPGRGSFINSNPGASLLGAIPYALSRPAIAVLFALKPELAAPKAPTSYADPRPNRTRFMNEMRARGLDVRLALAAMATQIGLMAPLGALAAVFLFSYLCARYRDEKLALWLALLYACGTPMLFRSAFLNQNALLAHAILFAWMRLTWPGASPRNTARAWCDAGLLIGTGLLLDYGAAPLAVVFGCWGLWSGWRARAGGGAITFAGSFAAGAAVPILMLLGYQWLAFGSPWFPAQHYMPATRFSVIGWSGVTLPSVELLWRNLFDVRYGLFVFCPMLVAALVAPFQLRRSTSLVREEVIVALFASAALWLFSSANQFASLQWNTGVRYLIPAVPLLFLVAIPVLRTVPTWGRVLLLAPTVVIAIAIAMTREGVVLAIAGIMATGPTLPLLTVLQKTAGAYAPFLSVGVQPFGVISVLVLTGVVVLIWGFRAPHRPA